MSALLKIGGLLIQANAHITHTPTWPELGKIEHNDNVLKLEQ